MSILCPKLFIFDEFENSFSIFYDCIFENLIYLITNNSIKLLATLYTIKSLKISSRKKYKFD